MRIIRNNARNLIFTVGAEQAAEISAAGLFPLPLVLLAVGDTHTAPHISPACWAELHMVAVVVLSSSAGLGEEREHPALLPSCAVTSGPGVGQVTTDKSERSVSQCQLSTGRADWSRGRAG